jgi:UrcA family protein
MSRLFCSATVMAVLLAASPLTAQEMGLPTEEITVYAPYLVHKVQSGSVRSPALSVTLSKSVSYHDLDLATETDAKELKQRVHDAAASVCTELDRRYPKSVYAPISPTRNCARDAETEGLVRAEAIIAWYRM